MNVQNPTELQEAIRQLAKRSKVASRQLLKLSGTQRHRGLMAMLSGLKIAKEEVLAANALDVENARQKGLSSAFIDRLVLDAPRYDSMLIGLEQLAEQKDVIGERSGERVNQNGLRVSRMRVPLGVIAMIYEARPNVSVDAAALAWKSGNAIILRGGSDAYASNQILVAATRRALKSEGFNEDAVQTLAHREHIATQILLEQSDDIDLAIPRGGESLVRMVKEKARVPVIQHFKGVCHLFLDQGCDRAMAWALLKNGKTQRPATCNATECLLVSKDEPALAVEMVQKLVDSGVEVRACERTWGVLSEGLRTNDRVKAAKPSDFGVEFLDWVIAVKLVDGFDGAIDHIQRYGSNHTETICTASTERAGRWMQEVDAGCVLVNASTRLHDGQALGLGAEVGISTSKLHAYGAMGVEQLTTLKWVVEGTGQTRD